MRNARRKLRPALIVAAGLLLWVAALYAPVRGFDFVLLDDDLTVTTNPRVLSGLGAAGVRWSLTTFQNGNWHPLTWWSHMLDATLFGAHAGGHHLVSAALHVCNAVLLFLLLRALTGSLWASAFAAALFGAHPLRVESVAWVSERKDVLGGLFWLLATGAHLRFCRRPSAGRYLAVVALFALGLMAKPMLVTLPFALLLLDLWPLGRAGRPGGRPLASLVLEKVPLFALAAAASVVAFLAQRSAGTVMALGQRPPAERIANALVSYLWYAKALVWPSELAVLSLPPPGGWSAGRVAIAALFLVGASLCALLLRRRSPWLGVGWLWYLGTLLPVIGLVQVGAQSHADRYTYLPLIGLAVAAAWEAREAISRFRLPAAAPAVASLTVLAAFSLATDVQLRSWRNSEALLRRAVAVTPNNFFAHNNLGLVLAAERRWDQAITHYRTALAIAPAEGYPHHNLAVALEARGRHEEAVREYETAIANLSAPEEGAQARVALAALLERLGRRDEARARLREALLLDPASAPARSALGRLAR
jgi:hypothetical protein